MRVPTPLLYLVAAALMPFGGPSQHVVETVVSTPTIIRVGQVAELAGSSVRSLQRDFAEYVGASPKWVIQRCRLQDAAARAAGSEPVDWAALALELGFADQAHLTRAFAAAVGVPPATYARQDLEQPGRP